MATFSLQKQWLTERDNSVDRVVPDDTLIHHFWSTDWKPITII